MSEVAEKVEQAQTAEQEAAMMMAAPQAEHAWLQKLVGEWTFEHPACGDSGATTAGTESVRSLGGLWVLAEGSGQMPDGSPASTLMTLGYDPTRGRFVGTWVGSMMSHLWVYEGELDPATDTLTLNAEGPSMSGDGTMARYQDIIQLVDENHRTLTSRTPGEDGEWQTFMTAHYHRAR